jgi:hypothetical protein
MRRLLRPPTRAYRGLLGSALAPSMPRRALGFLEELGARGGFATSSGLACFRGEDACAYAFAEGRYPTWLHVQQYFKLPTDD